MQAFRLLEHGTESYSIAIYLGGMTRIHLRVKGCTFNAGWIWRAGSKGRSSRLFPFLRMGNPEHPLIKLGV